MTLFFNRILYARILRLGQPALVPIWRYTEMLPDWESRYFLERLAQTLVPSDYTEAIQPVTLPTANNETCNKARTSTSTMFALIVVSYGQ